MELDIQDNDFNALLELLKSFPEVGEIVIGSSNDGTSPPIVTENEWPPSLLKTMKKLFPKWDIFKIGNPVIHEKTGCRVMPLELQN